MPRLYRGKRKSNGQWVFGYYACDGRNHSILCRKDDCWVDYSVIPSSVGQITDLNDCARRFEFPMGEPLYEGDVCSVIDPNGEKLPNIIIEWDESAGAYTFEDINGFDGYDITTIGWAMSMGYVFEKIGIIHDNPSLLEGGQ